MAGLDGSERMLDRASSDCHQAEITMDARLHTVECASIDEAMDRAEGGGEAACGEVEA